MRIETGDLIEVRSVHNFLGTLTKFFTRSQYTHAGLAIWLNGELFMAELNGGRNHLVPMTQLDDYDVFAQPPGLINVEGSIREMLRYQIGYAYFSLVAVGFLNWFKIKTFVHWRKMLVCTGYCVAIWEGAGWPEHSRVISPRELTEGLVLKLEVRPPK